MPTGCWAVNIDTFLHNLCRKIAWLLPRKLVFWCGVRLWRNYLSEDEPANQELLIVNALRSWEM